MPRLRKARSSSLELFSSSTGTRCGRPSTIVTSVPKDFHAEANSTPMTPPPRMIADFGTRSRISAWSEEMMRLPSIVQARQRLRHGAGREQDVAALDALAVHVDGGRGGQPALTLDVGDLAGGDQALQALVQAGDHVVLVLVDARDVDALEGGLDAELLGSRGPGRRSRRRAAGPWWGCSRGAGRCRRACPSRSGRRPDPAAPRAGPRRNRRYRRRGSLGRKRCWRRSPRHVLHAWCAGAGPSVTGRRLVFGRSFFGPVDGGPVLPRHPSSHLSAGGGTPGRCLRRRAASRGDDAGRTATDLVERAERCARVDGRRCQTRGRTARAGPRSRGQQPGRPSAVSSASRTRVRTAEPVPPLGV